MYVAIHTVDEMREASTGKTVSITNFDYEFTGSSTSLTVKAQDVELRSGKWRRPRKLILRTLTLELTAHDMKRLIGEAVSCGLVTATDVVSRLQSDHAGNAPAEADNEELDGAGAASSQTTNPSG